MDELVDSGRLIDWILGLVVIEALALALWHRLAGRGPPLAELWANLAAGGCLLLALRAALSEAPWTWIAAALCAALCAHLLDLSGRWRSAESAAVRQKSHPSYSDQGLNADFGKKL